MPAARRQFERNVYEPGNHQWPEIKHRPVCEQRREQLVDRMRAGQQRQKHGFQYTKSGGDMSDDASHAAQQQRAKYRNKTYFAL